MTNEHHDSVHGCLIGGGIGDALGAPVEGWSYDRIQKEYGTIERFLPQDNLMSDGQPGSITDDTVLPHYLCLAIAEHGGRVTTEEYGEALLEYVDPDRIWIPEETLLKKLKAGLNPLDCGRNTVPSPSSMMVMAPVGIVNVGDPRQAYQDGLDIASVHQDREYRDAAASIAAGIATAVSPSATAEDVVDTMLTHSADIVYRSIELALDLSRNSATFEEFTEQYYKEMLDWQWPAVDWDISRYRRGELFSANCLEITMVTIAILQFYCDDPRKALTDAVKFGRDCDTIASLTGHFVGALHGASSLPETWVTQCEEANQTFFQEVGGDTTANFENVADRMIIALEAERDRTEARLEELDAILGP